MGWGCNRHGWDAGSEAWKAEMKALCDKQLAESDTWGRDLQICPRCYVDDQDTLAVSQKLVDDLIDQVSEERARANYADVLMGWARGLPRCPRGCPSVDGWAKRVCCDIGWAVGLWEGREVAEALMKDEPPAGVKKDGSTVGFHGTHPGTRTQGGV